MILQWAWQQKRGLLALWKHDRRRHVSSFDSLPSPPPSWLRGREGRMECSEESEASKIDGIHTLVSASPIPLSWTRSGGHLSIPEHRFAVNTRPQAKNLTMEADPNTGPAVLA